MAYPGVLMLRDNEILQVMKRCKELGSVTQVHAENGDVIAKVGTCGQLCLCCNSGHQFCCNSGHQFCCNSGHQFCCNSGYQFCVIQGTNSVVIQGTNSV